MKVLIELESSVPDLEVAEPERGIVLELDV